MLELRSITHSKVVVRIDTNPAQENLPRTNSYTPECALIWILIQYEQLLKQGLDPENICFIVHAFIRHPCRRVDFLTSWNHPSLILTASGVCRTACNSCHTTPFKCIWTEGGLSNRYVLKNITSVSRQMALGSMCG